MSKDPPLTVVFTDDNVVAVELSDDFVAMSMEEQLKTIEKFFWEKNLESREAYDVSRDTLKAEYTILLAEALMAQLKKGVPLGKDGRIEFSLENLSSLENVLT